MDILAHDEVESILRSHGSEAIGKRHMINRTKGLVLALFAAYWLVVVVVLVTARDVYDQQLPVKLSGDRRPAEIGALLVLTELFGLLSAGIIRNWALDLLAGPGRLDGRHLARADFCTTTHWAVPAQGPAWFLVLQVSLVWSSSSSEWRCSPATARRASGANSDRGGRRDPGRGQTRWRRWDKHGRSAGVRVSRAMLGVVVIDTVDDWVGHAYPHGASRVASAASGAC